MRILLIGIAWLLLLAGTAHAQNALDRAADTLQLDPVYVDPDAQQSISDDEAEDLRALILDRDAGPLYIAVLPAEAANESGGDPFSALREIVRSVGEPGVYAAVVGDAFRAGSTEGQLPGGRAGELARAALEDNRADGSAAVLDDFVRQVGRARGEEGSGTDSNEDGAGFPWLLVAVLAVPAALFGLSRGRRRQRKEEKFAEVKSAARDEVIALGEEIRALDLDVEMPGVDEEAKRHYGLAVERYQEAEQALEGARRPEDLRPVSELLEEGRWAMLAARAKFAGEPVPERRAPCFFDPRHGPSVTDVEWAPPGGEPRPVPACAADAARVQEGDDPESREVSVNGRQVPYWQAGPAYGPFAGGFFGGGLVPGLFLGSMLGGGFGMFGGAEEAQAGDMGDMGDFGGGFGGGDFGGGDFGGGGGDF